MIAASTFLADEARALGAREVEVVPAGVDDPRARRRARRAAARPLRGPAERGEGDPRVRRGDRGPAARDRRRRPAARRACRRRSVSCRRRELGAVLRARGGRLRAVAARGLRHDRARGDGVRPAGRRDARRRPRRPRAGASSSSRRASSRRFARRVERLLASPEERERQGSAARATAERAMVARRHRYGGWSLRTTPRGDTGTMNRVSAEPIRVLRVIARLNVGGPALHVSYLTQRARPDRLRDDARRRAGRRGRGVDGVRRRERRASSRSISRAAARDLPVVGRGARCATSSS